MYQKIKEEEGDHSPVDEVTFEVGEATPNLESLVESLVEASETIVPEVFAWVEADDGKLIVYEPRSASLKVVTPQEVYDLMSSKLREYFVLVDDSPRVPERATPILEVVALAA